MPSTHSCAIAFFGVYLSLAALLLPLHPKVVRLVRAAPLLHTASDHTGRQILALSALGGAALVCWSRIRLGHHTAAQVAAGISLGAVVAVSWLAIWIGANESCRLVGLAHTISVKDAGMVTRWVALGARDPCLRWEKNFVSLVQAGVTRWGEEGWRGLRATLVQGLPRLKHTIDEL